MPDEYQRTLIDALQEQNIFRQLAHVITTTSGERKIPVVASHGTAAWIDEEGSYPESDDAFGQVSIGSYKLATIFSNKIDDNGVLIRTANDKPGYFAVGFMSEKANGTYRYVWLFKVRAKPVTERLRHEIVTGGACGRTGYCGRDSAAAAKNAELLLLEGARRDVWNGRHSGRHCLH